MAEGKNIKSFLEEIDEIKKDIFDFVSDDSDDVEENDATEDTEEKSALPKLEEFVSKLEHTHPSRKFISFAEGCARNLDESLTAFINGAKGTIKESGSDDMLSSVEEMRDSARSISQRLSSLAKIARFAREGE